nr:MAG TPA_asm: hypothetical protein [Caudoviricetes sp.]
MTISVISSFVRLSVEEKHRLKQNSIWLKNSLEENLRFLSLEVEKQERCILLISILTMMTQLEE